MKFDFSLQFFEKYSIQSFMKIRPVGAELFHADGRMDRHDEFNSHFLQFYEGAYKVHRNITRNFME